MAGAGYKLFNTGDVLTAAQVNTYLMEQSVMVFANAAARTTALSGVLAEGMLSYLKDTDAVEVYNGSAWVASDDPNAIQNSIVDAKGDLISASAADTPARLAVGNNGETLLADSSTTTGLRWQPQFLAGKNKIINGDFNIWQRGTSFSGFGYCADRWIANPSGATGTWSQQTFTPGTAPVAGYEGQFFVRMAITGADDNAGIIQYIEDVRTLAGQTATLSLWAKADTNRTLQPVLTQVFGSGGSADVITTGSNISINTSWTRYTQTITIPSIAGKTIGTNSYLALNLRNPNNQTSTIDYWGIQLEAGSVATPFTTATGTLAGELAACQRYYNRFGGQDAYQNFGIGYASSTTNGTVYIQFPVPMRVAPTSIDASTLALYDGVNVLAITAVGLNGSGKNGTGMDVTVTGATQFRPYRVFTNNSTSGYLGFSAEL